MGALMGVLQAELQGQVKEKQATESIYQAGAARTQAGKVAEQQSSRDRAILGLQRARFARAGVSLDTGSPLAVMVSSATEAAMNKANILRKGDLAFYQLHNQADMLTWEAKVGRKLSYLNVGLSLVADAASAFGIGGGQVSQQAGFGNGAQPGSGMAPGDYYVQRDPYRPPTVNEFRD